MPPMESGSSEVTLPSGSAAAPSTPMKLTTQTGQTVSAVTKAVTQSESPTRQELLRLIQQAAETSLLVSKVGVAAEAEIAAEVEAEAAFGDEFSADEIFQRAETARKEAEAALASAAVAATAVTAAVAVAVAKEVEAARARAAWARAAAAVAEALRVEQVAALQAAEKVAAAEATEAAEAAEAAAAEIHDGFVCSREPPRPLAEAALHENVGAKNETLNASAYRLDQHPKVAAPQEVEKAKAAEWAAPVADAQAAAEKADSAHEKAAVDKEAAEWVASSLYEASSLQQASSMRSSTEDYEDVGAEDETLNAEDETLNAKDETLNAKDWWEKASPAIESAFDKVRSAVSDASPIIAAKVKSFLGDHFGIDAEEAAASAVDKAVTKTAAAEAAAAEDAAAAAAAAAAVAAAAAKEAEEARAAMALEVIAAAMAKALRVQAAWQVAKKASAAAEAEAAESAVDEAATTDEAAPEAKATAMANKYATAVAQEASPRSMMSHLDGVVDVTSLSSHSQLVDVTSLSAAESHPQQRVSAQASASRVLRDACALMLLGLGVALLWMACAEVLPPDGALSWAWAVRALDDTWGAASGAFAHARTRIGQLSWSDVVDGADAAAVALSSLAQTLAKRGALARASLLIAGRARLCAQLDLLCEAARRDAAEREAAAAYFPQLVEFASKVWTEARSGLTSALS